MQYRKFISFFLFLSFILITFSGFVLYIMPHGRVAYWTDWRFIGLNKDNWSAIHTIFCIVFILIAIFHLIYNWKPFKLYINKNKKEMLVALTITAIIFSGTLLNFSPFKNVIDIGEKIKSSWKDNKIAPKIPHGELLPLKVLCKRIKIDMKAALERLKNKNIKVDNINERVIEIAKKNNLKPVEIYLIIKKANK